MYVLNLAADNRILSACVMLSGYNYEGRVIVDKLPDTFNSKWMKDYYYIDGEYIYDPVLRPEEQELEPTIDQVLNALLGVEV